MVSFAFIVAIFGSVLYCGDGCFSPLLFVSMIQPFIAVVMAAPPSRSVLLCFGRWLKKGFNREQERQRGVPVETDRVD